MNYTNTTGFPENEQEVINNNHNNHDYASGSASAPDNATTTYGYCDDLAYMDYTDTQSQLSSYGAAGGSVYSYGRNRVRRSGGDRYDNDPEVGTTKVRVKMSNNKYAWVKLYVTNYCPGSPIRNAMDGTRNWKHVVGSADEYLYFKVSNSVGNCKQENEILFFENPKQFEKLFNCVCSQQVIDRWTFANQQRLIAITSQLYADNTANTETVIIENEARQCIIVK